MCITAVIAIGWCVFSCDLLKAIMAL